MRRNDGEYGFDDVGYRYDSLKKDYQKLLIDSIDYNVPWMGILNGQIASVAITSTLTTAAANDTTLKVTFRPTNTHIRINGQSELGNITPSSLKRMNELTLTATEWDTSKTYSKESILVISNKGDTIGKLNVSCQRPIKKKIAFIYVNSGAGYRRSITKNDLLKQLNTSSHNQIFIKYSVRDDLMDTLNVVDDYRIDSATAKNDTQRWLSNRYKRLLGNGSITDLNRDSTGDYFQANDSRRTYLFYITTFNKDEVTLGETATPRDIRSISIAVLFNKANTIKQILETTSHEVGHELGLEHTFFDILNPPTNFCPHIPIYSTQNFMDYKREGFDQDKNCFYFYQWVKSNYY